MKRFSVLSILAVCAAITLAGASCAPKKEEAVKKPTRSLSVYKQQDKDDYSDNIRIKIEDLEIHLGKLRQYRDNIVPSSQSTYDAYLSEFDDDVKAFSAKFEAFKATPFSEFLDRRAELNAELVKTEDLYLKIITDFKVDIDKQP